MPAAVMTIAMSTQMIPPISPASGFSPRIIEDMRSAVTGIAPVNTAACEAFTFEIPLNQKMKAATVTKSPE